MEALKEFRKRRRLTQKQMAEKLGINRVKYTKIELGYREPDLDFIRAFEKAFNVSPKQIHRLFIASKRSDTETSSTPASHLDATGTG